MCTPLGWLSHSSARIQSELHHPQPNLARLKWSTINPWLRHLSRAARYVPLDTVSAYYMFGCAVCALLRQLHTVFGIQFHSQDGLISSPSGYPLACSLAVIYVQLMLRGFVGCGSAHNDVQKQLKAADMRTLIATMHAMHFSIFISAPKLCVRSRQYRYL